MKKFSFRIPMLVLFLVMSLGLVIGCDKGSDDEEKKTVTELQGTWQRSRTETTTSEDYTYVSYITDRIIVDGSNFRYEVLLHADETMSSVIIRTKNYYTFEIGEETTSGKNIDLVLSKVTQTNETQDWCDVNNMLKWYGYTDWNIGDEKDITGKCSQEKSCVIQQPAAGTEFFTVFTVNGSELSINTGLGETIDSRPTGFDTTVFVKQ